MKYRGNFIGGRFILPRKNLRELLSEDPGDLDHPVGSFQTSESAVHEAVLAAKSAFWRWSALSYKKRAQFISRFGRLLKKRAPDIALLITRETGKTLEESKLEVERVIAKCVTAQKFEPNLIQSQTFPVSPDLVGTVRFRPLGVMAILSPFNVPASISMSQTISALLSGATVVLKPSELTPFVAQELIRLWQETGLPKGVLNLVQGAGGVGKALTSDPDVGGILFTGSWETGSRIQTLLLKSPEKFCALEMGGKNAAIVCRDADLKTAVQESFTGAYLTTGQRCNATSRIILEKTVAGKFIPAFLREVDRLKVGYGTQAGVFMGPVASKRNFEHFLKHIKKAKKEGFEALRPGGKLAYPKKGYYLKPSVHLLEGTPRYALKKTGYLDYEVLGPDTAIIVVSNLKEAIELNNRPRYGLVTSVFTRSRKNYEEVFRKAETGLVHWNAATFRTGPRLPFGGLKRSGNYHPAGFFTPYLCTTPIASIKRNPKP